MADHPCTFATLTAPSFGPVHGVRQKGPCRARRDKPVCEHGRPLWCTKRHRDDDPRLGEPLCVDCYDYTAHVVWQWHAPELWRRFCIALQRELAKHCGLSVKAFRQRCVIAYAKVVEFQVRGAVHVHAPIRLDGPDGADGPRSGPADHAPATSRTRSSGPPATVSLDTAPLQDGTVHRLHWGRQVDTRSITDTADRDSGRTSPGGAPPPGRGVPGEVPDQDHRGLRTPRTGEVRRLRTGRRRLPARGPDHPRRRGPGACRGRPTRG